MRFGAKSGDSGGYQIEKSLRLRKSASAYLSRVFSGAGNRKTWTYRTCVKRGALDGVNMMLFACRPAASPYSQFWFVGATNALSFDDSTGTVAVVTSGVYRDPAAHLDIVLRVDTTQATAADRVRIYVNGIQVPTSGTYPALNADLNMNIAAQHEIGRLQYNTSALLDAYLSEPIFVDGQSLGPESFGQFDPTNPKRWIPKKYTGTYGTNGFYLPFNDGTSTTTLGQDRSGNGNNWTLNNVSLTAGATYDWMSDTPTNNFATWNPLIRSYSSQSWGLSNGNLQTTDSGSGGGFDLATVAATSGKFYMEHTVTAAAKNVGVGWTTLANIAFNYAGCYHSQTGYVSDTTGGLATTFATFTTNDRIGVAVDVGAGKVWFRKNGTWLGSGNPETGANPAFTFTANAESAPTFCYDNVAGTSGFASNYGQQPWVDSAPTGFKALCTANLPTAAIPNPLDHYFKTTVTKSGDTNITIPWDATQYDTLIEIKRRDASGDWYQVDGLRGYDKILKSNSTAAETTDANVVGVSGTTITLKSTLPNGTYLVKCRKAGLVSARQTNTSGTITSTVSANTVSGFSIVTWVSNGISGIETMGHGLGVALSMNITKNRSAVSNWVTYHKSLGNNSYLLLDSTNAAGSFTPYWSASSTTWGQRQSGLASNGNNCVAYCHAEVAGYSKFGAATGNGSADGWFAYANGLVGDVLLKDTTNINNWYLVDSARNTSNLADNMLTGSDLADSTLYRGVDLVSNGLKLRPVDSGAWTRTNALNSTIIYALWNDQPIQTANAR